MWRGWAASSATTRDNARNSKGWQAAGTRLHHWTTSRYVMNMGGGQTVWRLLYTLFLLIALVTVAGCDKGKGPDGQDDAMLEATEALHRAKQKVRTGTWRIIFPSFSEIRKHTFSLLLSASILHSSSIFRYPPSLVRGLCARSPVSFLCQRFLRLIAPVYFWLW